MNSWFLLWEIIILAILLVLAYYDGRYFTVPNFIVWPAISAVIIFNLFFSQNGWSWLLGLIVGGLFYLSQYWLTRGKDLGFGDVLLGILSGAILGYPVVIVAIFLTYLMAAVIAIGLLVFKKEKLTAELPLGVFINLATIICIFSGEKILLYLNL